MSVCHDMGCKKGVVSAVLSTVYWMHNLIAIN